MNWNTTSPAELLIALRPGGWLLGESPRLPNRIRLHKTEMIQDVRQLPATHKVTWKIAGDPNETGHYAPKRRTIVIWLGA